MAQVPRRTRSSRAQQIEVLRARQERLLRDEFVSQDLCLAKLRRAAKWANDAGVKFGDPELVELAILVKRRFSALADKAWRASGGDKQQSTLPFEPPTQEPASDGTVATEGPSDLDEPAEEARDWPFARHE